MEPLRGYREAQTATRRLSGQRGHSTQLGSFTAALTDLMLQQTQVSHVVDFYARIL
jgi:adenine-specific DNA glycosylase